MEERNLSHLRLVSTVIADRLEEALAFREWVACSVCGQEYYPHAVIQWFSFAICDICLAAADTLECGLVEVFGDRKALIDVSRPAAKFTTTAQNKKAFIAARDFDPDTENLYLYGDPGTGKTMLAAKIIHASLVKSRSCAFRIAEAWLRGLYGATGIEQQAAIDRLVGVRVLVFDEVGFEPSTEFSARALYDVINTRMLKRRNGLVVTSNLSLQMLGERMKDDRISSRLGGMCKVIEVGGRDWRQPA